MLFGAIDGSQAIRGWPGPSADGLGPRMAPNSAGSGSGTYDSTYASMRSPNSVTEQKALWCSTHTNAITEHVDRGMGETQTYTEAKTGEKERDRDKTTETTEKKGEREK